MRTRLIALVVFVAVLAVGAWVLTSRGGEMTNTPDDAQASQPPSPDPIETLPASPTSEPTAQQQSAEPSPATSEGRTAAVASAVEFVTAWLDQDAEDWWQRLEPLMTTAASEVYASVDPDAIPPGHTVRSGQARYLDGSTRSCRIEVATTEGTYIVTLLRAAEDTPWRVERLDQPAF